MSGPVPETFVDPLASARQAAARWPYLPALLVLCLALLALLTIWQTLRSSHDRNLREQFEFDAQQVSNVIASRMFGYEQMLRGAAGLWAATGDVDREQWLRYVGELGQTSSFDGLQGLGFALFVTQEQKGRLDQFVKKHSVSRFVLWPSGERVEYGPIVYLAPSSYRNQKAIGYDMFSEPVRRAAMMRARDHGGIAYSHKVVLVQEDYGSAAPGFLMYLPVYLNGVTPPSLQERRRNLLGWVYMPFRAADLMGTILKSELRGMRVEVFTNEEPGKRARLFDSSDYSKEGKRPIQPTPDFTIEKTLYLDGGQWLLRFSALPDFAPRLRQDPFWVQLAALGTIALLLVGITLAYISKRRSAQEALRLSQSLHASEERLRTIFYKAPVGIVLIDAASMAFIEFNNAACAMLSYSRQEMAALNLLDIQARLSPEQLRARMYAVLSGQSSPAFENRHRTRTGEERDVLAFNSPIRLDGRDFILAIWQDITTRKQVELERAELADLNRKIIYESTQGVMLFREDGSCVLVNDSVCRIFASSREHILKENFRNSMAWRNFGLLAPALETLALNARTSRECRYQTPLGREVWLACDFVPFTSGGQPHLLVLISDVSSFRHAEQTLRLAKDMADAANQSKSDFLANMSHEIRTPMNTILGMAQLLQRSPMNTDQQSMLHNIVVAGAAMLSVINDILEYSRIEAGHLLLEHEPFLLPGVLDTVAAIIAPQAKDKGLDFQIQAPNSMDFVLGDQRRLAQVLVNLLGNAVKFTEQGRVSVRLLCLDSEGDLGHFRFVVSDTGIGIAPEKLERIFGAFEQADVSTTRRFGGTGLGLSISRGLVHAMGGSLSVHSQLGQGSEFVVDVPLELFQGSLADVRPPLPNLSLPTGARLSGIRILVVDDSAMNLDVAKRILEGEGAYVETAEHGAQALKRLRRADGEPFHIVLMDLHMPIMDGFEATEHIRRDLRLSHIPVLAVSAGVLPEQVSRAQAVGINAFVGKPYDLEMMVSTVLQQCAPQALPSPAPLLALPAPCPQPTSDSDAECIHWEELMRRLGGDVDLFQSLAQQLRDEFAAIVPELQGYLEQKQWATAAARLHKLKGCAGNLAAHRLSACAQQGEQAMNEQRAEADWLVPLEQALRELLDYVAHTSVDTKTVTLSAALLPEQDFLLGLDELRAVLAEHNLHALKLFQTLRPNLEQDLTPALFSSVEQALARLDFSTVLQLLNSHPSPESPAP